jgi:predicted Holliday junction resolvase-like endonuclease
MAGLGGLQADLEAELEAAERLTDWFNQKASQASEERRRSYEESRRKDEDKRQQADARRQVLLGWIALFGLFELAGFLGLANSTGFHLGFISFTQSKASWEDWVIVALLVIALLFGLYYYNNRVERLVRQVLTRGRKVIDEHSDTEPADQHRHEPHRGRLPGHS